MSCKTPTSNPPVDVSAAVLIVDDQDYFRGVLRDLVQATPGFELVGEAASGEEALEAAERVSPSLVIIDKRMPGIGGIETCRRLVERDPDVVVVITSIEDPDPRVAQECGAAAFLRKQELSPRRLEALWREHRPQPA